VQAGFGGMQGGAARSTPMMGRRGDARSAGIPERCEVGPTIACYLAELAYAMRVTGTDSRRLKSSSAGSGGDQDKRVEEFEVG